jgi:ribosomal protein L14
LTFLLTDRTSPSIGLCSSSSNSRRTIAMSGDTVTMSVTASKAITTPTVKIGGVFASTVTRVNSTSYIATRVITSADSNGVLAVNVISTDLAGNSVTSTTDSCSVIVGKLKLNPPLFYTCKLVFTSFFFMSRPDASNFDTSFRYFQQRN